MRVLWFTNTPSLYKKLSTGYNGGGWIESLEELIGKETDIELGIGFFHSDSCFKSKVGKTTYYPISLYRTKTQKVLHNLFYSRYDADEITSFLKIIDDFKPDIIHIFGSERSFGLVSLYTNIPVVIHIQGILNPYLNAYFAPGSSKLDLVYRHIFNPKKLLDLLRSHSFFTYNAKREVAILRSCKHFMGRTSWDKNVVSLYAPRAKYFYCGEILRNVFYDASPWIMHNRKKIVITSTISKIDYKGFDTILKTARLLKELSDIDFEWNILGITEYREWEKKLGIFCKEVSLKLKGVVSADKLIEQLLDSDIYIHPSYIDNSPNSVCEAQILGLPTIATNVGGISSLIAHDETGILVPANDPYSLACNILKLSDDKDKALDLGKNARRVALARHNKENIISELLQVYNRITNAKALSKIV